VTTALFPGTFDPITLGHVDILERACALFDRVIVAVGARHDKQTIFTADERVQLIRDVVGAQWGGTVGRSDVVDVQPFDGLIVNFARSVGAGVLVRGIRNELDFAYENQMAITNRRLASDIDTVFLAADPAHAFLSSSLIKEILKAGGSVAEFVPPSVATALAGK